MTGGSTLRQIGDWVVRERKPAGPGPHRLLLLIHGWTGDENSMWIFSPRLPANRWLAAPRAPHVSKITGYSWRDDSQARAGSWPTFEDLQPAARRLLNLLTPQNFPGANLDQIELAGFSQGGALAYAFALLYPQRVRRLAALSTFMPRGAEVLALREPLQGLRVFVAHGSLDKMVPPLMAQAALEVLEQAGAQATYCENEVGHKLGADCFCALEDFFLEETEV